MKPSKKVSLFVQCLVDAIYPEVGESVVQIMNRLGISTTCPEDQTCCGQTAFNSGYRTESRAVACRFIDIFEHAEVVVCPSGSCVSMVRHYYPILFRDDPALSQRADRVAQKTFELTEYLVEVLGVFDLGAAFEGSITYHDSCHLMRSLGIREQPRTLIKNIRGAKFVEMKDSDQCCGFGGAFSIKYPDISGAMLKDKVQNIIDSKADVVVGCDMGCLMNIDGMLRRLQPSIKVKHIAQILAG